MAVVITTQGSMGPLFRRHPRRTGTFPSGTIYVLRSLSTQPNIAAMRHVLFKVGVTGGRVEDRICNAERDPTYLLAPVEIVATWKLANIRQFKFEQTIHRILASAQLQLHVPDRFGIPVSQESGLWFRFPSSTRSWSAYRMSRSPNLCTTRRLAAYVGWLLANLTESATEGSYLLLPAGSTPPKVPRLPYLMR